MLGYDKLGQDHGSWKITKVSKHLLSFRCAPEVWWRLGSMVIPTWCSRTYACGAQCAQPIPEVRMQTSDSRILASSTVVLGKICLRMSEWAFANNCKLYSLCIAFYCIWICAGLTSGMQRKRLGVLDKYAHVFFGRVRNNLYIACSFGRQPIEEGGVSHSDLDTVFNCWKCKRVLKTSWSATKTSTIFLRDMSKCISNEVVRH